MTETSKISTGEAAKILGVSTQAVRNWVPLRLKATQTASGRFLFNREDVLALAAKNKPPIETDGLIDPVALYERVNRRVPNSLEFVRTLVEHGCDQSGVVTCCDEIFRQVARNKWEAMVRGWEFAFATHFAEFLEQWTYRKMTDAQAEQYRQILSGLVAFVKEVEFGREGIAVKIGEGEEVSFAGYPVNV